MTQGALSSLLEVSRGGGLERAVFEVSPNGIKAATERAKRIGEKEALNETLCGWYTGKYRPFPEDILSTEMTLGEGGRIRVTLLIRRGHLVLSTLLRGHEEIIIKNGEVRCTCHPERVIFLNLDTLPSYPEFEER